MIGQFGYDPIIVDTLDEAADRIFVSGSVERQLEPVTNGIFACKCTSYGNLIRIIRKAALIAYIIFEQGMVFAYDDGKAALLMCSVENDFCLRALMDRSLLSH